MFRDDGGVAYQNWCMEQLPRLVLDTCSSLPNAAEQRDCGESMMASYDSIILRHSAARCAGITRSRSEKDACLMQSAEDADKAFLNIFQAWEKVRLGAAPGRCQGY